MKDIQNQSRSDWGRVSIVGAGPGEPDLLTIKALRNIQSCDVVLYDKLVSDEILQLIPNGCTKFFVGKSKNRHSVPQQELNQLLVKLAKKGKNVCRLKGGDPFVFGRGSEEILTLHQAGVKTEVIPGITAASGCASYAGIPLTHRNLSQGCTFVTGHAERSLDIEWEALANMNHTLVFYMGLSQLQKIKEKLTHHGLNGETSAALIENGCRNDQRVISGKLEELDSLAALHQLESPTLIVIGEVVNLREKLTWLAHSTIENDNSLTSRLAS